MKKIILTLLLITLLCSENYEYKSDISVLSNDGTKIAANAFIPKGSGLFPAIIFPNSWAMDEHQYYAQAELFATKGYIVFSYSSRGWGKSGGKVMVASPQDMKDLSACIDWVLENTPVDKDNIGISGISYGAGISMLGLAHDDRIKTAVAMSGWGNLITSLYGNETPHVVWSTVLLGSGYLSGNMDPSIYKNYRNLIERKNIDQTIAWAKKRSPIHVVNKINQRNAPVYISNNFQDEMFQPNSVVELFEKLSVPKRLDLNLGIHASAELSGLIGLDNYVWKNTHDWFDHWLKGEDTGIMEKPMVNMAIKNSGKRNHFTTWPSQKIQTKTYHLTERTIFKNGGLSDQPASKKAHDEILTGILSGISTGIPIIGAIFEAHTPIPVMTSLPLTNPLISIVYHSPKLEQNLKIRGAPQVELWVTPTTKDFQIIAHLYKVDFLGIGTLITHAPITIHNATPNQPMKIKFDLVFTSYDIKKGQRIAIGIDNYDLNYKSVDSLFSTKLMYGSQHPSQVTIPFVK